MCSEHILELISCHLDGCNTPEQEAALQEHLSNCPDCRSVLAQYKKTDAMFSSLRREAPASLAERVMSDVTKQADPKPKRRTVLPFRYGTAVAAVAAVFLLVIGSGRFGTLLDGTASINPPAAKQSVMADTAAPTDALLSAPMPSDQALPANVDCQALAQAEKCLVGVLTQPPEEIEELKDADFLLLSGGRQYAVTRRSLLAIADRFPALELYYPDLVPDDDEALAYLIIVMPEDNS